MGSHAVRLSPAALLTISTPAAVFEAFVADISAANNERLRGRGARRLRAPQRCSALIAVGAPASPPSGNPIKTTVAGY